MRSRQRSASQIRGVDNAPHSKYAESTTLRIANTWSRQRSASPICGVHNAPHRQYAESTTLRIANTRSRQRSASSIRGVANAPHRRYAGEDSSHQRYRTLFFFYSIYNISEGKARRLLQDGDVRFC